MIPARIINIDDKVMVSYPIEPDYDSIHKVMGISLVEENSISRLIRDSNAYKYNTTIAEVENAYQGKITKKWFAEIRTYFEDDKLWGVEIKKIAINQTVFIEPTENNKCQIIKI